MNGRITVFLFTERKGKKKQISNFCLTHTSYFYSTENKFTSWTQLDSSEKVLLTWGGKGIHRGFWKDGRAGGRGTSPHLDDHTARIHLMDQFWNSGACRKLAIDR